jgi:hypothetical protein
LRPWETYARRVELLLTATGTPSSTAKMSYTIKEDLRATAAESDDGSSSGDDRDSLCDWASSLGEALTTQSLFTDTSFPNPQAALNNDETVHGYNLKQEADRLGLDLYGRMKLINYIRGNVSGVGF